MAEGLDIWGTDVNKVLQNTVSLSVHNENFDIQCI